MILNKGLRRFSTELTKLNSRVGRVFASDAFKDKKNEAKKINSNVNGAIQ